MLSMVTSARIGPLSFRIEPRAARGELKLKVVLSVFPVRSEAVPVRLRHCEGKRVEEVLVDGKPHADSDAEEEWVVLPRIAEGCVEAVAHYCSDDGTPL